MLIFAKNNYYMSFGVLLLGFLLIMGISIAGVIMLVLGIMNNNKPQWAMGAGIVAISLVFVIFTVVSGIKRFTGILEHQIERNYLPGHEFDGTGKQMLQDTVVFEDNIYYYSGTNFFGEDLAYSIKCYTDKELQDRDFSVENFTVIENGDITAELSISFFSYFDLYLFVIDHAGNNILQQNQIVTMSSVDNLKVKIPMKGHDFSKIKQIYFRYIRPLE
jgi:hypothetical protein